ncbi:hypothetical protein [Methylobacterium sp. ARG-1]|uniref:hypothetical protein n=1 Tax=Methylobacterium sp. ARG-1 TaxID=1692501 RepID=UPI001910B74C|nr:hypothetical protein [Methylobacterium sp. ARG-1]
MTNASVPAAAQDVEQPAKIRRDGTTVVATRYEIDKLIALCALLTEHPAVFPAAVGQPVLPLAIGNPGRTQAAPAAGGDCSAAEGRVARLQHELGLPARPEPL